MKPAPEWCERAEYISVHGFNIATWHHESGDARPWLLLIHGFPTSSWDWTGVWDTLSAHFNLAALDMLGFGLSDKPRNFDYRVAHQADLQEAMLEQLGVSEAHFLAHDYGDTVAQELLARHNENSLSFSIKSVCFLNGGLFAEQHRPALIQKIGLSPLGSLVGILMNKKTLKQNFERIYGANTPPSDGEIDAHWKFISYHGGQRIFHRLLQYIPERSEHRERWVGALQETRVPLYLINGGVDPISGKHMYEHFKSLVPQAGALLFDDIGHYPQTEAPERVSTAFLDFHKTLGTTS